jgi:hypothetical protein
MRRIFLLLTLLAGAPPELSAVPVDFERQIAPTLVRRCTGCHNASDPAGRLDLSRAEAARKGGESGEPAIVSGDPAKSNLLARIRAGEMPPEGKGTPATPEEVAALEAWIAGGAAWPEARVLSPFEFTTDARAGRDWWSLVPPQPVAIPPVADPSRLRTPIDVLVAARLDKSGLSLSDEADRATLIRRATLDLVGLPPEPEEIERFVADTSPDAYERLVDRLLASPRYGERWARHWLDVVRFGESNGYETNTARENAWPYRDWVIQAFNDDLDYRQFITAQLAGDQQGVDAATGFLVGGAHDTVSSPDAELTAQQRMNDLDDMITTTSGAFLGLSVGCAKCHDHKFDPISQRDYYQLQAIFAGVQHGERDLHTPDSQQREEQRRRIREQYDVARRQADLLWMRGQPLAQLERPQGDAPRSAVRPSLNVDRFAPNAARFVRFTVLGTNNLEPCLDELEVYGADMPEVNLALAAKGARATASSVYADGANSLHKLEHVNDGRHGNAHSWISGEPGAGWVLVELPQMARVERVVWARDREGKFKDRLPTAYRIECSADGESWQTVANAEDRRPSTAESDSSEAFATEGLPAEVVAELAELRCQVDSLRQQLEALTAPKIYGGTFKQPEATHVLYRGEPLQKREPIAPGGIASVGAALSLPADAPEAVRRVALAKWIASNDNPLTARVIVNRIWHHHFGQGLVRTPSDLGWGGGRPSHPELLDWLARELMAQGWRLKPVHRAILLSSVYRQSSRHRADAAAVDAGNQLLWRFAPRRLEAEAIRDCMLWTSGVLDLRMGGRGYDVFEPNTNYVKVYTPKREFGPAEWRRMVYQDKPRLRQDATFGAFDCPDSSQAMPRRNVSTTALQALNLLNGPFVVQQAGLLADRLKREAGDDPAAQTKCAFWLAFGRAPDDEELAASVALVAEQGLTVFCRAMLNANEFLYLN